MPGILLDRLLDRRRVHQVGEAVAAQQERRILLERRAEDVDESGIVRPMGLGPDVAVHLVAPGMVHRVRFGDLPGIFTLADRRMILRQLLHPAVAQLVEPCVSDVTDHHVAVVHDRDRKDARHALPFGP